MIRLLATAPSLSIWANDMYKLIYRPENILPYPCTFSNSEWTKLGTSITDDVIASATGDVISDKLVETTASIAHRIGESVARDATEYTAFTIELKAGERYDVIVWIIDSASTGSNISIRVNLSTGEVITAAHNSGLASLTDWIFEGIGGGWYLVGVAGIAGASTGGNIEPRVTMLNSGTPVYVGDNVSGLYMCNARLYASSVIGNEVSICPDWNFSKEDEKVQHRHKAVSGIHEVYKYGDFDARKFDLRYVSSSDAAIINSWWHSNAELLFTNNGYSDVFSCMITNRNIPIGQVIKPYHDQFKGTIELGEY